ncbi:sensor histidine kinase [Flavobacterium sp. H122]|uniref:sensor histidine kinase n=1 Tax=Flavobacterium sp. H122 TaxID=2529860 RepID=UPI0020BF7B1E|nr:histidine kinase [Flavobacterium sp. H122]
MGLYNYFASEFLLWLIVGVFFNVLLYNNIHIAKDLPYLSIFFRLIFVSIAISSVLWLLLYFPVTYFTTFVWSKITTIPTVLLTFYTNCFIISVWYFFFSNLKFIEKINNFNREKSDLELSLKESQLNALKGQINPHFMFNSLNNIRGLILEDPVKSREMITRLSEMLRYSLTKNDIHKIGLDEEVEMVDNYIAVSKIQLEDRLQFIKELESGTLNLQIPPMILQMLIENAVKHGISNLKQGGMVKLIAGTENDFLNLTVINTGKLLLKSESTQIGLKNIKDRLHLLYADKADFKLYEENNQVVAKIQIPLVT